jgi:hypothetical protein
LHRSLKRNLVIGLAALALAACAGGAYAATQTSGPSTRQAFLNDVAKRLHVTPQQLNSALSGAATDQLQAAVKAGQITQAQANELEQWLKSSGTAPLLPPAPGLAGPRPFARPRGGPFGGGSGPGPLGFPGPGLGLGAAASYLGLTNAQLFQQLQSGKSLAQIATAKGKTVGGLEQAMTAPVKKALNAAVASKGITAAREKQILSRYSAGLSQRINQKGLGGPQRGFFRGGGGGGGRGAGPGHPYWGGPGGKGGGPAFVPPSATPPKNPGSPANAPQTTPGGAPAQLFMPAPTA